jgi:hypothetical protein
MRSSDVVKVVAIASVVSVMACGKTEQKYSNAVDSGAVAPAARPDLSLTKNDTNPNAQRTGKPGVAGETLSTRGRPVGTGVRPDTTRKRP